MNVFDDQLDALRERIDLFEDRLSDPGADINLLAKDLVNELGDAFAELSAIGEELETRNQTLLQERARAAGHFEFAPTSMLLTNADGIVRNLNDACAALVGIRKTRVLGRTLHQFVRVECVAPLEQFLYESNWDSGESFALELRFDDRFSTGAVVESTVTQWKDASGEPSLLWTMTPKTLEQTEVLSQAIQAEPSSAKLQEETVRRVGRAFRNYNKKFVQAVDSLVVVVDVDAKSIVINESVRKFLGTPENSASTGRAIERFTDPEFIVLHRMVARRLQQGLKVAPFEVDFETAAGIRRIVWSASSVVGEDGNVLHIVYTGRDVTHERELESQLVLVDRLESIGLLAGGLAHDFSNLLTISRGNLELALDAGSMDEDTRTRIEFALDSVEHAGDIAKRLLEVTSGTVAEGLVVNLEVEVILTVSSLIELLSGAMGHGVHMHFSANCQDAKVAMDPLHLEQVILNLITNCCDAMEGFGSIWINVQEVESGGATFVELLVRDSGPGMDQETIQKIFEPLFSNSRSEGRTGLGLATVRLLVESRGGTVNVVSELGHGCEFQIRLPKAK